MDDRRVLSGIVYVIRNGFQWKDAPKAYGPHKTLYNRFIRWGRLGVFDSYGRGWPFEASDGRCHPSQGTPDISVLAQKGAFLRHIGRTKGGLNSKLHAVCDGEGRLSAFI
ncbi:MAG: transposase [Acetobacter sp.]|nr:transposase [Acetobacter sp.]MCH4062619.1 transposase [Acetobacter sp.]MCH4088535.1 transposase [Acetobacter sp.]MCI1294002.1 transposase [Acetobacter sp.]MCI1320607.1 transposase [Acetobacter sp.]